MYNNDLVPKKMYCISGKSWLPSWGLYELICIIFINNNTVYKFKDTNKYSEIFSKTQFLEKEITISREELIDIGNYSEMSKMKKEFLFSDPDS